MNKIRNKRIVLYALLISLLGVKIMRCSEEKNKVEEDNFYEINENSVLLNSNTKIINKLEDTINAKTVLLKNLEKNESKFIAVPSIVANTNVNIRKAPSTEADLAGKLVEGHTLELLEELENGWYKVLYYGEECYVSGDYTLKTTTYKINGDIKKVCYTTSQIEITIPSEISKSGLEENLMIPNGECLEIYEETEENYLVQSNDFIGYVAKNSLESLTGTFVVVDISDQELKLYQDNEIILETPIITGNPNKKNCRTNIGLFEIFDITEKRYLKGTGYQSYVDVMMKFDGNIGLHDAEYHYCENGIQNNHGWRSEDLFGGNTYLTNGSHGCVNMPHDSAMIAYDSIELGTKVLVKK